MTASQDCWRQSSCHTRSCALLSRVSHVLGLGQAQFQQDRPSGLLFSASLADPFCLCCAFLCMQPNCRLPDGEPLVYRSRSQMRRSAMSLLRHGGSGGGGDDGPMQLERRPFSARSFVDGVMARGAAAAAAAAAAADEAMHSWRDGRQRPATAVPPRTAPTAARWVYQPSSSRSPSPPRGHLQAAGSVSAGGAPVRHGRPLTQTEAISRSRYSGRGGSAGAVWPLVSTGSPTSASSHATPLPVAMIPTDTSPAQSPRRGGSQGETVGEDGRAESPALDIEAVTAFVAAQARSANSEMRLRVDAQGRMAAPESYSKLPPILARPVSKHAAG